MHTNSAAKENCPAHKNTNIMKFIQESNDRKNENFLTSTWFLLQLLHYKWRNLSFENSKRKEEFFFVAKFFFFLSF
jgi:hypothetical protein